MKMGRIFIDMIGKEVELFHSPKRIVSLVPSQTELLYALGLNDEVVGITKFCVHPDSWFRNKTRVGGTKNVNIQRVADLRPHLIIANKEENTREQIEELSKQYPVWVSDIANLKDAMDMILGVGQLTNKVQQSIDIADAISLKFSKLDKITTCKKVAYFIWKDPWMCAGGDTFISDMICKLGWKNVFEDRKRYPEVTLDELYCTGSELVLLSSEPYPFKQQHINDIMKVMPSAKVVLVDGEMFSWYGSRLLYATDYFKELTNEVKN